LKRATLIYNPVAGRNPSRRERHIQHAGEILQKSGLHLDLARTAGPGSATELARQAVARGDEIILACGGDGTINEVINGMCPGKSALAILPGGTANIIAKELGLPHDPVRAAGEFHAWKPRRIALGRVTGIPVAPHAAREHLQRYFLSVAGVGFDAYVIHRLTFGFKMSLGVAAYVLEGARQWARYSFPPILCHADGRQLQVTFAIVQRTSRYAGWFRTAPRQSIINSHFAVSLYTSPRRLRYIAYALGILCQRRVRDIIEIETRNLSFTAVQPEPPVYFEVDGELAGTLPASFEVVPDALTLFMP
jgi:YegS/Rv2252/BmrU family lipid kinase